jgi:hypothetical protein
MSQQSDLATSTGPSATVCKGGFQAFGRVCAPGMIDHDPAPDQEPGSKGVEAVLTMLRSAAPDLRVSIDRLMRNETDLAMANIFHGGHKRDFAGVVPCRRSPDGLGVPEQPGARVARN